MIIIHTDITSFFLSIKDSLPIEYTPVHIEGYQNDNTNYEGLTRLAHMNIIMYLVVKKVTAHTNSGVLLLPTKDTAYPSLFPSMFCNGHCIYDTYKNILYSKIVHNKTMEYWIETERFSPEAIKLIDRRVQGKANNRVGGGLNRLFLRWTTGVCGIGKICLDRNIVL